MLSPKTPDLFPDTPTPALPAGFEYHSSFISSSEEADLLKEIERLDFAPYEFRGVLARRRVVAFGYQHDYRTRKIAEARDMPAFLLPVRGRIADLAGVAAEDFRQALVSEYSPGTPIGWHVDRAHYGAIAGLSLLTAATFRLRRREGLGWQRTSHEVDPRSLYIMRGEARTSWQHSIPPVSSLRFSVTFRTMAANFPAL